MRTKELAVQKILVIEATPTGEVLKTKYQAFKQQGYELYFIIANQSITNWYLPHVKIAESLSLSCFVETATQWHTEVNFDAVVTLSEMSVSSYAAICHALNLPGLSPMAAKICRNKFLMRQAHQTRHVPHPKFELVFTLDQALDAAQKIGFPVIIKPTLGAGSEHIYRIDVLEQMKMHFYAVLEGLQVHSFANNEPYLEDRGPNGILVEEFLNGHEHSLEAVIWDNEIILGAIGDRLSEEGLTFDQDIYTMPTRLNEQQLEQIRQIVLAGAKAQGIQRSVIHPEIRFHNGKPYLVEIGARAGGGPLSHMSRFAYDHCPIKATLEIGLNQKPNCSNLAATGGITVAIALVCEEGRINAITIPDDIEADEKILYFKLFVSKGDTIRRPPNGNELMGQIAATGRSVTEAFNIAMHYYQKIKISVIPIPE